MLKKCKTKCQADKHLWICNDVFYYMVELPRNSDGKRRYFCKSLHTTNYYEALEKAGVSQIYINKIIGWKGQNTMQQHYSKRRLDEIKAKYPKE